MFRAVIAHSPFYDGVADECFPNIIGESYNSDVSFLTTLRAVLAPRIPEDTRVIFSKSSSLYSPSQVEGLSNGDIASNTIDVINNYNMSSPAHCLHVHMFSSISSEVNEKCANALYECGKSYLEGEGWIRVDKVTAMFKQRKFMVACFINPQRHFSVVFVEGGDLRKYHMIQSGISVYMPWLFEGGNKLTQEELALMNILYNSEDADAYQQTINKMSKKYDFRGVKIRSMLNGFESKVDQVRKDSLSREIDRIETNIRNLNSQIAENIANKYKKSIELLGLETKISQNKDRSEIMDYFMSSESLVPESLYGNSLTFCVKDYLMYYDEDLVERMIENKGSSLYTSQRNSIATEDMVMLMREVFLEQSIRLRICAAYKLTLGGSVSAVEHFNFGSNNEFDGYMPNPHIQYFGCLGANNDKLNRFMSDNNYVGAIEQCISSCRSLNFADGAVISQFFDTLYSDTECFELPDGSVVTTTRAIEWIKKSKEAPQEAENE